MPSLSLQRTSRRQLLAGRRRQEHVRPLDVRPPERRSTSGGRPAGKWTDAATGEHGDLLDVIRESCGLVDFHDVADEARRFLSLPRSEPKSDSRPHLSPVPTGSPESARRLFAMSQPIAGTVVETYLRGRGITDSARHRQPAIPSALLLSSRGRRADRNLAGDDRGCYRSSGSHHRRASHLARSVTGATRRRSIPHAGRWAIFSGTRSVSVRLAT